MKKLLLVCLTLCAGTAFADPVACPNDKAGGDKSVNTKCTAVPKGTTFAGNPVNRYGKYPDPKSISDNDWLGLVPDASLTPGAIDPCMHAAIICKPGYKTTAARGTVVDGAKVSKTVVDKEYSCNDTYPVAYNSILYSTDMAYKCGEPHREGDHVISLEIGGANDDHNLWPQPDQSLIAGSHDKDQIEDHAEDEMCDIFAKSGAAAADDYMALLQRAISGGFTIAKSGRITPPAVSWYHLYFAAVLDNTDHKGNLTLAKGAKLAFEPFLNKNRALIKKIPAPAEFPSGKNCTAPKISP